MDNGEVLFSYFAVLLDILEDDGIDVSEALLASNLDRKKIVTNNCMVKKDQVITMLKALELKVDLLGKSLEWGKGIKIITHGDVGFAAMSAQTMDDALRIAAKYISILLPFFKVDYQEGVLSASLDAQNVSENIRVCLIEIWACAIAESFKYLTGNPKIQADIEFDFNINKPIENYISSFGGTPAFDMNMNRIIFNKQWLGYELPLFESTSHESAIYRCESSLERSKSKKELPQIVAEIFSYAQDYSMDLEYAANKLCVSPRTLARKLDVHGTSFREIRDQSRKEAALLNIGNKNKSLSQIADLLGFSDVSNFSKSFKKWTGETPSSYRRKLLR